MVLILRMDRRVGETKKFGFFNFIFFSFCILSLFVRSPLGICNVPSPSGINPSFAKYKCLRSTFPRSLFPSRDSSMDFNSSFFNAGSTFSFRSLIKIPLFNAASANALCISRSRFDFFFFFLVLSSVSLFTILPAPAASAFLTPCSV